MTEVYKIGVVIVFIIAIVNQIDAEAINLRDKSSKLMLIENVIRNKRENLDQHSALESESENHTVVISQSPSDECKTATTTIRTVREKKELFFGVLLPSNMRDHGGSPGVLPAMELAVNKITAPGGILEGWHITMEYRDTQCSSVYGPLAAFELYTKQKPGF